MVTGGLVHVGNVQSAIKKWNCNGFAKAAEKELAMTHIYKILMILALVAIAAAIYFCPAPVTISITAETAVTVQGDAQFQNYPLEKPEKIKIRIPEVGK
jgi:ABC-type phosphate transport system auxiliary subunit